MLFLRSIALLLACFLASAYAGTPLTTADAEKWREDLRYFAAEAPKTHKNLYHSLKPEEFHAMVSKLDADIPKLTREQVMLKFARIVTAIGDGHSYAILWRPPAEFHSLPVRFYLFRDGLYVIAGKQEFAGAVGAKVIRIGDVPAAEAMQRVEAVIAHDNESDARERLPVFLGTPEALEALQITRNAKETPLTLEKDGKQFTVAFPMDDAPITRRTEWKLPEGWVDARTSTPLWLKNTDKNFWSEYLPDAKTMYVQYNSVYPQGDVVPGLFFQNAIKEAEEKGAERFVIDARLNNGGNNGFNRPIIHAFIRSDRFNQRGKLFTIIGRRTFSAAQNFVNHMELDTQTLFVGEPTGGRPNHYGDNVPLILPNSKLEIRLSTLWWQDVDPRDTRQWRSPDIATAITFADYRDGKDPALRAILAYGAKPSVAELVRAAMEKGDIALAKKALSDFKADPANEYVSAETPINRLGYELLSARKVDQAIPVFKLNTEEFPESANVWDSLGEAYMAAGRNAEAITAYEKAYAMNPKNGNARAMIQRLKARP